VDDPLTPQEREAIAGLAAAYAAAVDGRHFERLRDVFTADAVLDTGASVREGIDEIVAVMEGLRRYESTAHLVGEQDVTPVGPDRCKAVTVCTAHHLSAMGAEGAGGRDARRTDRVMYIRYHDDLVRTAVDGWRIDRRRLEVERVEERVED